MVEAAFRISLAYYIITFIDPYILAWQTLNRPIIIAPLTGLILGDLQTGIIMGAALESIFMGISAIGGQIPADAATASVIAVSFTILTGGSAEAGLALSMPIGTLMARFNELLRPLTSAMAPYWETIAHEPKKHFVQTWLFHAVMMLIPTIVLFFSVSYGIDGIQNFLASMPAWFMTGLNAASGMMIGVGFAMLASMIWSKKYSYFFIVGFVFVVYLQLDILAIAIIGASIAATIFIIDSKIINAGKIASGRKPGENVNTEEEFF